MQCLFTHYSKLEAPIELNNSKTALQSGTLCTTIGEKLEKLDSLSNEELSKILDSARTEIQRREIIAGAIKDIKGILEKHKMNFEDLYPFFAKTKNAGAKKKVRRRSDRTEKQVSRKDGRRVVEAKFVDPKTGRKWSGRGRTPTWVSEICKTNGIDVKQFKNEKKYRL